MGKPITITNCVADPDSCPLSKGAHEQATWKSNDGKAYHIHFNESPFSQTDYDVPAGGSTDSGAPGDVDRKKYKYSIRSPGPGGCSQDPDVDIQP